MSDNQSAYQERTFTIPAGDAVEWHRYGVTFGCLNASGNFFVKFDGNPRSEFRAGLTFKSPVEFNLVRIENRGSEPITVDVFVANGDLRDSRLTLSETVVTREALPIGFAGHAPVNVGQARQEQIFDTNRDRVEAFVSLDAAATGPVFLTGPNGGFSTGVPLFPGQTATLKTTGEIWAANQTGADVNVYSAETVMS